MTKKSNAARRRRNNRDKSDKKDSEERRNFCGKCGTVWFGDGACPNCYMHKWK